MWWLHPHGFYQSHLCFIVFWHDLRSSSNAGRSLWLLQLKPFLGMVWLAQRGIHCVTFLSELWLIVALNSAGSLNCKHRTMQDHRTFSHVVVVDLPGNAYYIYIHVYIYFSSESWGFPDSSNYSSDCAIVTPTLIATVCAHGAFSMLRLLDLMNEMGCSAPPTRMADAPDADLVCFHRLSWMIR